MKARTILLALFFTFSAIFAQSASAEQFVTKYQGRQVVVHTSRIPVIMHRLVPPQYGRHITVNELNAGKTRTPVQDRLYAAR